MNLLPPGRPLPRPHAHDVVHRDVKPDNVWLAADGSAGLGDFGIAMVAGDPPGSAGGLWCGGHGADSMP